MLNQSYQDIPLPKSEFGERFYLLGRELTEQHGLGIDELVWDCDELLWDWVLSAPRELITLPRFFLRRFGHHEWARPKAGVFEIIWGMHHAALEAGTDPHMRISTNGYSWRLHRYSLDIPGFAELVGQPASATEYVGWDNHPRVFCRQDYVAAMQRLLEANRDGKLEELLSELPAAGRAVIEDHLQTNPYSTSLKLPELATLVGKPGFTRSRILLDDSWSNCDRFVRAGRSAVRAKVPGTHKKGEIPNTTWGSTSKYLDRVGTDAATSMAAGLKELALNKESQMYRAVGDAPVPAGYKWLNFEVSIPSKRIGAEWVEPARRLKKEWGPNPLENA